MYVLIIILTDFDVLDLVTRVERERGRERDTFVLVIFKLVLLLMFGYLI